MGLTGKKRHGNLQTFGLVAMTALVGVSFLVHQVTASATGVNWMDNDPVVKHVRPLDSAVDPNVNVRGHCRLETVTVAKTYEDKNPTMELTLCLNEFNGWRFGQANGLYDVYASNGGLFYKVNNLSAVHWFKGTDTVIGMHRGYAFGYDEISHLKKYHNFTKRFTMNGSKKSLDFDMSNPAFSLDYKGKPMYAISWGISNNGRYLVYSGGARHVNAYDIFSRIDLETGERKVFGRGYYDHTHNVEPQPSVAVSNDGTQVVIGGTAIFKVWRLTPECLVDHENMNDEFRDPCPTRMIYPKFYGEQWKNIEASHERISANDDFTELTYQHRALRGQAINEVVTISIAKDEPQASRLDYLAMGDSYSSGEGDIYNGESVNYIRNTGGEDGCHLSDRSYPFILAKYWNVKEGRMQSIACSGARVVHDYISRLKYYQGQNKQAKSVFATKNRDEVIQNVRDNFLPGYIPQIEFVREYRPKVITLTGGGNDVGFGDILEACNDPKTSIFFTCSCAADDRVKRLLKDSIHNQYGITKLLVKKLKEASPGSKIYVVGYPQFIEKGEQNCFLNGGLLNHHEREAIFDMTKEMNEVLWRAATDSGVPFVDITDALSGGRLCGGDKYMTGLHNITSPNILSDRQNLYHPNPNGHLRIARQIAEKVGGIEKAFEGDVVNTAREGGFYQAAPTTRRINNASPVRVKLGEKLRISSVGDQLMPHSTVRATLYSTPTDLGTHTVGASGRLNLTMNLPSGVQPGRHTLVIVGALPDGKRVTYYDFVTVEQRTDGGAAQGRTGKGNPEDRLGVRPQSAVTAKNSDHGAVYSYGLIIALIIMVTGGLFYAFRTHIK